MLSGRLPFEGGTPTEVIAKVLEREPASLTDHLPDLPAELDQVVRKALTKEREERYQTATDMLIDLKSLKQQFESGKLQHSGALRISGGRKATGAGQPTATAVLGSVGTDEARAAPATSSAEYIVSEIKRHKRSMIIVLATLIIALAGIAYFVTSGSKSIDSLAVLPFTYVSTDPNVIADPDREYLSDGITESLINSLSQLPNLKVIARSSVFRYKGKETDLQAVRRELGVRTVLVGRIIQHGDDLSISVELVDTNDNRHIWGEQYNRRFSDILTVQEEISAEISDKLRRRLSGAEKERVAKRFPDNPEAYRLYLKGRYFWNKRTADDSKKAIEYFNQAIEKDPTYALAYVGLADCYAVGNLPESSRDAMAKARAAANRALEIDDGLAEAHASLGLVKHLFDWDWSGAEREYKRAIELNPNYASVYGWYGMYLAGRGRFDESLAQVRQAQELDPLSVIISVQVGNIFFFARRYDQAIAQYQKTLEMDPNFRIAHDFLGLAYEAKGTYEKAITEFLKFRDPEEAVALKQAYAASGWRGYWQKELDFAKVRQSKGEYLSAWEMSNLYSRLGEKDLAFEWLEKAYREHDNNLWRLKAEPVQDSLHSDPRFAGLLKRMGLEV
jgi:TolB-like protein/Tfp pilus assembly protein PilF